MLHRETEVYKGLGIQQSIKNGGGLITLERKDCFRHMEGYYQEIAHKLFTSFNKVGRE